MVSFLGRRGRGGSRASFLCAECPDVREQLQQLFLAELPLKGRHLRRIAGDDLRRRIEDRFADVGLVGRDGSAALELYRRAVQPVERQPPDLVTRVMTVVAISLVEETFAMHR